MAGIDFRLVQAVSLTGCRSTLSGEKEIQQGDEKTSTDEQEARALDRLRTFITHIFCHVRHGVQQAIQRQANLNHFRPALSAACSSAFRLDGFLFCRGDDRPFLRQELTVVLATKKYWSRLRRTASISSGSLRLYNGPLHAEFSHAVRARIP